MEHFSTEVRCAVLIFDGILTADGPWLSSNVSRGSGPSNPYIFETRRLPLQFLLSTLEKLPDASSTVITPSTFDSGNIISGWCWGDDDYGVLSFR